MWSLRDCLAAGFKREELIPVTFSLSAANKSQIEIVGAVFIRLYGFSPSGNKISCATMVYISPSADGFFFVIGGNG